MAGERNDVDSCRQCQRGVRQGGHRARSRRGHGRGDRDGRRPALRRSAAVASGTDLCGPVPRRRGARCADDAAGVDHPRLLARLHPAGRLGDDPTAVQRGGDVVGVGGLDPLVAVGPRRFHRGGRVEVPQAHRRPARRLGARRDVRRDGLLRTRQPRAGGSVRCRCARSELRAGTEPAAAEPRARAVPPADPVPRLRRDDGAVRVRHRRPDHRSGRRGLVARDAAVGPVRLGIPHHRDPPRWLVELRRARLERCVGVGPRGERQPAAVVDGDGVHPLGARPGAPRDAARLEPLVARGHVRPDDPRHVPHPFRRAVQRPRLR